MKITIKAARVNKNLSQKEAAKLIGVSKDTIGAWIEESPCQMLNIYLL